MASELEFEGTYGDGLEGRPLRRFVVKNWTNEDHNSFWDGQPILIKAGDMRECDHAVAYKLTKEIVDKAMFAAAAEGKTDKEKERAEMAVLNPTLRKPYEDKTLMEIKVGDESPIMQRMREELRAEIRAEKGALSNNDAVTPSPVVVPPKPKPKKTGAFADLG